MSCLHGLLACFDSMAGANSLRVVGVRVLGVAFLGSDLPGRRAWLDYRMRRAALQARGGACHVTAREMAGMLKPPTVHCAAPEVLRARAGRDTTAADRRCRRSPGSATSMPLGRKVHDRGRRAPWSGCASRTSFFSYIAAAGPGAARPRPALGQCLHLVRSGHGGLFLDPHAGRRSKRDQVVPHRAGVRAADHRGRPRRTSDSRDGQPGWNLFCLPWHSTRGAAERRVEAIVDCARLRRLQLGRAQ